MKAFISSICVFLFLLLGVGQTSYGFSSETNSLQKPGSSKHTSVIEHTNDKAVAVEQLTLAEPEVSVSEDRQQTRSDCFSNFNGSGVKNYTFVSSESNYLVQSAFFNPSCTSLVLIFPFHLFP